MAVSRSILETISLSCDDPKSVSIVIGGGFEFDNDKSGNSPHASMVTSGMLVSSRTRSLALTQSWSRDFYDVSNEKSWLI